MPAQPGKCGPLLFFRKYDGERLHLVVILACPGDDPPLLAVEGKANNVITECLHRQGDYSIFRYSFSLPARPDTFYTLGGVPHPVNADFQGDLRLAYVSCDGMEHGDHHRHPAERNVLWTRLSRDNDTRAFHLLLQGGDQLYADELCDAHPLVARWAARKDTGHPDAPVLEEIRERLSGAILERYLTLYGQPESAPVMARVPSLCMWDDHDICDGWGSLPEAMLDAPVGRTLFEVARRFFCLFQLGALPEELPEICLGASGDTLSWMVDLPGVRLVAPDLRSERRPDRVMGPAGWQSLEQALSTNGSCEHLFLLSSVPVLGPRLSWVETFFHLLPSMQKYEDDLRDQWQSRAHRTEWQRLLERLLVAHEAGGAPVTLLSGEIHLATRGTLASSAGPLHQLVASGISHPPPPGLYATLLGALARLGKAPLPDNPISLHPLPGQRGIYTPQRNYLVLERQASLWRAWWELEKGGPTPSIPLNRQD